MYRDMRRFKRGDPNIVHFSSDAIFKAPYKFKGPYVFVNSWSDFFISEADVARLEAWHIIRKTPHLTYQIPTKRPERILSCLPYDWGDGYPNVWLGVSAEDQSTWNERVPLLLKVPARVRFVSIEPMLQYIDIQNMIPECNGDPELYPLDWIIVGGESGHNARFMRPHWARIIKMECERMGVSFFMKQMTGRAPIPGDLKVREFPII